MYFSQKRQIWWSSLVQICKINKWALFELQMLLVLWCIVNFLFNKMTRPTGVELFEYFDLSHGIHFSGVERVLIFNKFA